MFDFEEIKKQASMPELALWAAVVSEAVTQSVSIGKNAETRAAARRFFLSNNDGPGTFVWCAGWLGLDVEAVRTQMRTRWILSDAKAGRV
jgi:L-fucose isomerase-like protein